MNNFNNSPNNQNNNNQNDWCNNSENNYPQSDYTQFGWNNNSTDYPQNDYTEQSWGNNFNSNSYSSQNYYSENQAKTTDFQKYCSGSFNDYNCSGRRNKSSLPKTYVNNSYFSSGYTIPSIDSSNTYSPIKNNPYAVFIGDKGKYEKFIFLLPFPIIFLGTIIGAIVNDFDFGMLMFNIMAIPFIMVFAYIILNITVMPIIKDKYKTKRCKLKLKGTVVDIRFNRISDGRSKYTPIYKYSYNGMDYYLNGFTSDYENIKVGTEFDVYINPHNPKQHYISMHESGGFKFNIIISVIIIIAILLSSLSIFISTHFT